MIDYFFYFIFLIIALPILVSAIIYWWLYRKGYKFWGLFICVSIVGLEFFVVYTALFPLDGFYKDDFEFCTKLKFPESGKIISKNASYPDFQGQYSSASVIRLSEDDFNSLLDKVNKDSSFTMDNVVGWRSRYFSEVTK